MERPPTRSEIEAELQSRREKATRRAGSHISDGSRGGARVDLSSPSSRISNAGADHDLHKRMLGLEENMKLILSALKIGGLETTESVKNNLRGVKEIETAKEGVGGVEKIDTATEAIAGVEKLDTAKEAIEGLESLDTINKDIEGIMNLYTAKIIGGLESTETVQEKIERGEGSKTLENITGPVQGDVNVRNFFLQTVPAYILIVVLVDNIMTSTSGV